MSRKERKIRMRNEVKYCNKREKIFMLAIVIFTLGFFTCNTAEPPDNNGNGQDTTSHNFTFETFTFGQHSSSLLYNVAIINENNIWAVGEIYLKDSLGNPDPHAYNAVHWDGNRWDILRIPTKTFSGSTVSSPVKTIFCFNKNDIWTFSVAGSYSHWKGSNWVTEFVNEREGSGNKLLGISSTNLYLVCSYEGISFYNGTNWQKKESGTDLDIYDIVGNNGETGVEIYAVAANQGTSTEKKIFQLKNNSLINLPVAGIPSSIKSIWFKAGKKYYVVGSGMYTKTDINSTLSWESIWQGITQYYTKSIDGNDLNDIVVCGAYGEMLHYNGATWKSFQNELQMQAGAYNVVKINGNFIIAVGYDSPKAVITIGRR